MNPPDRRPGVNDGGSADLGLRELLRRPSAFVPLAMSLGALTIVLAHVAIYGAAREADEGTAAHLWQLLMAAQIPVIGWFAIKWLPEALRPAGTVLALHLLAALAAMAPVYFLHL